jgi:hypothetical protein
MFHIDIIDSSGFDVSPKLQWEVARGRKLNLV